MRIENYEHNLLLCRVTVNRTLCYILMAAKGTLDRDIIEPVKPLSLQPTELFLFVLVAII